MPGSHMKGARNPFQETDPGLECPRGTDAVDPHRLVVIVQPNEPCSHLAAPIEPRTLSVVGYRHEVPILRYIEYPSLVRGGHCENLVSVQRHACETDKITHQMALPLGNFAST